MKPIEIDGRFWRPNATASEHVAGRLVFTHQRIHVDLSQPIAEWKQVGDQLVRELGVTAYPVVHGELTDGRFVTLVEAETGLSVLGPTTLRAKYCLIGLFVVDDPRISYAQIEYDWLDSWLDSDLFYDDSAAPVVHVEVSGERLVEAAVSEGVAVALAAGMFGDADVRCVSLTRRSYFEIVFDESCDLGALLTDHVRPLQDLVTLCLGRAVRVTDIRVAIPGEHPADFLLECLSPINQATEDPDIDPARLVAVDSPMVMTGAQLVEHFGTLIPAWYATRGKYSGAVSKINAPAYARFMYLENRAAITVQAVEALHTVQFGNKQMPTSEHKKRYKAAIAAMKADGLRQDWVEWAFRILSNANYVPIVEQITHLLELAGPLGGHITSNVEDFAKGATALRNLSSHGSGEASSNTHDDVERAHFLTELVQWAVRVALLSLTGAPDVAESAKATHVVTYAIGRLQVLGAVPPKPG
ncbi:hypothetical protein GCM10027265_21720 [Jatrophihabitans fulvus]